MLNRSKQAVSLSTVSGLHWLQHSLELGAPVNVSWNLALSAVSVLACVSAPWHVTALDKAYMTTLYMTTLYNNIAISAGMELCTGSGHETLSIHTDMASCALQHKAVDSVLISLLHMFRHSHSGLLTDHQLYRSETIAHEIPKFTGASSEPASSATGLRDC